MTTGLAGGPHETAAGGGAVGYPMAYCAARFKRSARRRGYGFRTGESWVIGDLWLDPLPKMRLTSFGIASVVSNGGMLAVKHVADHAETPAMVLLSAHGGGRDGVQRNSRSGMLAGDRLDEIAARARRCRPRSRADAGARMVVRDNRRELSRPHD